MISHWPAALVALATAACGLPRDADGTLDRVRGGTMRVGVVDNPPWVVSAPDGVGGVEGAFVTALARELGARPEWVRRPESELLEALRERELDLVIGGLTSDLPWKHEVAFTKPYYTDTIVVGAPAGATPPDELDGHSVAVEAGSPAVAAVRKEGATPVPVADLTRERGLIAAPSWRLSALGREPSGITLHEVPHAIATPPGENAWLVHIERRLRARRAEVPRLLRSAAP